MFIKNRKIKGLFLIIPHLKDIFFVLCMNYPVYIEVKLALKVVIS
jgi:hypothetical protein